MKTKNIKNPEDLGTLQKNKNIFSNFDQIIACTPGSVYWKDIPITF